MAAWCQRELLIYLSRAIAILFCLKYATSSSHERRQLMRWVRGSNVAYVECGRIHVGGHSWTNWSGRISTQQSVNLRGRGRRSCSPHASIRWQICRMVETYMGMVSREWSHWGQLLGHRCVIMVRVAVIECHVGRVPVLIEIMRRVGNRANLRWKCQVQVQRRLPNADGFLPLPDEYVVHHGTSAEYDAHTDQDAGHYCRCWVELRKSVENNP